ncbi:hypothetical protein F5887DRAFT_989559 [Amanita rubescens]|nr:hypothetical protein F5887DRAFT_989559 [Amanita rubescens]
MLIKSHCRHSKIKEGPLTVAGTDVDTSTLSKGDHDSETYPLSRKQVLLALFLCMYLGWNDGGLGALLPRIQRFYDLYCSIAHLCHVHDRLVNVPLIDKVGFRKRSQYMVRLRSRQ